VTKVRFRVSAQVPETFITEDAGEAGALYARLIVHDVQLRTAEETWRRMAGPLEQTVVQDIHSSIATMANRISRGMQVNANQSGPTAQMAVSGTMSQTAVALGWGATFYTGNTDPTIGWKQRTDHYMGWKRKHNMPENWWVASGELTNFLSKEENYITAFGPIEVRFRKEPVRVGLGPNFARMRGATKESVTVGRLEVSVFGNITKEMLPSLASGNPSDIGPAPGIAKLFENVDRSEAVKLLSSGRGDIGGVHQRRVIDPFVSFYLTRAIPDAVYRRISERFSLSA
jgi:hypothetical protein